MARPREFDIDETLARAMEVFWAKGYEGASLHDLLGAIVEAVLYLDKATFVTGEVLHVDGGQHAGHWSARSSAAA